MKRTRGKTESEVGEILSESEAPDVPEVDAMRAVLKAISSLTHEQRARVLRASAVLFPVEMGPETSQNE